MVGTAVRASSTNGRRSAASLPKTDYEKNRNPFWNGRQFPAGVCRAGKHENRRQRYRRGIRQDGQGHPGRTVRVRRGDRSNLAGRTVLSGLAQERGADGDRGGEQSVL